MWAQWRWADKPSSRYLWCQHAFLTFIRPDNHFQTSLFPAPSLSLWFTSRSSNYLAFFISECVCKLQTCCASPSALLPILSLPSPLAGTGRVKGGEPVCVKWDLYCSPSSNTLSLEWAGNNPWGSVQSNCNPQHIPLAGSPLHCCSRAGAVGAHARVRCHFPWFAGIFPDSAYITWPNPIIIPSEEADWCLRHA